MANSNLDGQITEPGYREAYNINPRLRAINVTDDAGNPTAGQVQLVTGAPDSDNVEALKIVWQSAPRGKADGTLAAPNGAFIEDVLWAAHQRLEFFQDSKYRDRGNALAITHIEGALQALKDRQLERSYRNVEGKHEV